MIAAATLHLDAGVVQAESKDALMADDRLFLYRSQGKHFKFTEAEALQWTRSVESATYYKTQKRWANYSQGKCFKSVKRIVKRSRAGARAVNRWLPNEVGLRSAAR